MLFSLTVITLPCIFVAVLYRSILFISIFFILSFGEFPDVYVICQQCHLLYKPFIRSSIQSKLFKMNKPVCFFKQNRRYKTKIIFRKLPNINTVIWRLIQSQMLFQFIIIIIVIIIILIIVMVIVVIIIIYCKPICLFHYLSALCGKIRIHMCYVFGMLFIEKKTLREIPNAITLPATTQSWHMNCQYAANNDRYGKTNLKLPLY